jgi:diguanylate cyclase (GGDEF)-like protein/PAS domain S-box-containing protein
MTYRQEEWRISMLGAAIFAVITVVAGLLVYSIMQRQAEFILGATLELSLQSRASLFEAGIANSLDNSVTISTRPHIIQQIKKINQSPGDAEARLTLQRAATSFLSTGLTAVAIGGADGRDIAQAGSFVGEAALQVPIAVPDQVALLWKDGFVLRARIGVFDQGKRIGSIRSEASLSSLSGMIFDTGTLGTSGELAICAPLASGMRCFPSTHVANGLLQRSRSFENKPLPMSYALAGKSGVINAEDYRGQQVVAAYRPVGTTGLGMVLKLDRAELYQPIKRQLRYVLPVILLLIAVGMLLLNWLVAPLLRTLVRSEQETRHINAELSNSETRLRAIFDSVDDGIVTINAAGVIESFNPAMVRIFGYRAEEVIGRNISMLMPEPERSAHDDHMRHYLDTREARIIGTGREVAAQRKDGTTVPIEIRVSEMHLGTGDLFIGTVRDISARKQAEERIMHLATHDPLTDLPNRTLLNDRLEQAIAKAGRRNGKVAVLYLDLDDFKLINDTHGHDCGDHLLVEVARRITALLRNEDTIARQGGDEFIVALADVEDLMDVREVAQRVLDVLAKPYLVRGHLLNTTASIGVALYPENGTDAETLISSGDHAMYCAKKAGRNKYYIAESATGGLRGKSAGTLFA